MRPPGIPQAYTGQRLGLWRRRVAVASHTLGLMLKNRWVRYILFFHLLIGVLQAGVILLLGKLATPSSFSMVNEFLRNLSMQWHMMGQFLFNWITTNPDVAMGTSQNVALYFFCTSTTLPGTLVALALVLPHLVCRDIASSAMTIYLSKALGRRDYLLGKAGAVMGLLGLSWILPTLGAWLLGNLLTGELSFFQWSLTALGHSVIFMGIATLFLTALALGVSSLGTRDSMVITQFFILWGVLATVAANFAHSDNVLRHISFSRNLQVLASFVFDFRSNLKELAVRLNLPSAMTRSLELEEPSMVMPGLVLLVMATLGIWLALRATRSA